MNQVEPLILLLLMILPEADTFVVHRPPQTNGFKLEGVQLVESTMVQTRPLFATVASTEKPTEKLTKEAQEFLDALEAKESGDPYGPSMLIAQVAPSFRIALPEEFGLEPGAFPPTLTVAALKELGFDYVLDTNTGADVTIAEEATELLQRLEAKMVAQTKTPGKKLGDADAGSEPMPLFTSCCPGWMNYIAKSAPELVPYISTCKSPHMMYGALVKAFSEDMFGTPADKIYFCSVMPCVWKRGESDHAAFEHDGIRDIDNVLTTRDVGQLLRMKGIHPPDLMPKTFDSPFQTEGTGSGAGQLFGATGGVMEAALRTAYEILTGETLPHLELDDVRGLEGIKEAVITIPAKEGEDGRPELNLRVAVANGLGNAKKLIKKMKDGEAEYDFVEVMACPGGCIGGGGQPRGSKDSLDKRLACIYELDRSLPVRQSHENPVVKKLYEKFLENKYGSPTAHRLLHVEQVYGKKPELKPKPKRNVAGEKPESKQADQDP